MTISQNPPSELTGILSWLGNPPRSPNQTHGIGESDSEILKIAPQLYLASTIDTLSEEIEFGLYQDPYTMGWVTAHASLSDLAAVGATPLGMLFSSEWKRNPPYSISEKARLMLGFNDALTSAQTYLLGGDTGDSKTTSLSGVGLGLCDSIPLSRKGMNSGDWICITGQSGIGPSLALRWILGESQDDFPENLYRPCAQIQSGILLRKLHTPSPISVIDTSDGILSSLTTLQDLNGFHFDLIWNPNILAPEAVQYLRRRDLPLWLLWANEHGDYQLLVTVPDSKIHEAETLVPHLHRIGRVTERQETTLEVSSGKKITFSLSEWKALIQHRQSDFKKALSEIIELTRKNQLP